jgi:signal transduction histidine kinase
MRDLDAAAFEADGARMIEIMSRNSAALRHIVDELLDLAALDSGHATIAQDPVDLTATVRTAVEAAAQAGVTLDLELADDVVVIGDRIRLAQVVTHLLDNAIKHSRPGAHVTVTLAQPCPAAVELTVADTGIGIPDDEHQQVFTRFYRSSCTRQQGIPGAGLGLAISRAIVDRHHGSIRLMPQPTPGVRIVVRLPVNVAPLAPR